MEINFGTEKLPDWPIGEDGTPVAPVFLFSAENTSDYETRLTLMRAYGIPVLTKIPNQAFFSPVIFGTMLIGADLYVPETLLEDAKALLSPFQSGEEELPEG